MSLDDFQLLNNEPFDESIIERDYLKTYHQQGAQFNQSDQNIEFIFGENSNYHRIGNGYLEFDRTVRKNDGTYFHYDDPVRLVNNGFAFCFKETRLSTTLGSDLEHNTFCGPVSTIMKVISNKDGNYPLNLVILMKVIFQFLRDLLTYHPKLNPHHTKKGWSINTLILTKVNYEDIYI